MRLFATLLFSFALSFAIAQRNCATMDVLEAQLLENPMLHQHMQSIEQHNDHYHQNLSQQVGFRNVITIPVVFHIIHNGDAVGSNENLAEAFILAQLAQLNDDFRKMNADAPSVPPLFQGVHADTEIQFCLAQRRPDGTATNGINRVQFSQASWTTSQVNSTVKPATIWNRDLYLNVWTVVFGGSSSGVLGFAQFPGGSANTDGVVVAWNTVGSLALPHPNGGNYALGRTLAHEVGHWLNLRHIWGDATCGNDFVADTPVHQTSNSGCPPFPKTNNCAGGPWTEMTMNYMDYTFDACMYMFSEGQKTRMRAVLDPGGFRFSLNSSLGCVPPGETCTAPTLAQLNASNITTSSARLNCSVTGVNAYDWRYRVAGTTAWTEISSTTANSADISGLAASTTYEFQAMVQCGTVWSAWSPSQTFTTTAPTCDAPLLSQLFTSSVTQVSARLHCAVTGVNAYDWRFRQVGSSTWIDLPVTTVNFVDVSGLSAATTYEFQVMVQCGSIWSDWSPASLFSTPAPVSCNTPAQGQYSVTEITATSARFNCTVTGVSAYLWRYRQLGAFNWTDLPSTTVNYTYATSLQPQTTYEMQVALVCQGTQSNWSKTLSFTTTSGGPSCTAPSLQQLSTSSITENSATLQCSLTGVLAYYWRYRQQGASSWVDLGSTPGGAFPLSNLSAATTYEFQVAVMCNPAGQSDWSPSQTFTTLAPATCAAPGAGQLSATAITPTSAQLNCSATGASIYFWRYRPSGTTTWTSLPSTVANFTSVSGLTPATDYEFQVSVQCTNGVTSDWSASQVFSTSQETCDPPSASQFAATNITPSSARLSCTVSGVTAFQWRYRASGASSWIELGPTAVNFYDLTGLSASTEYEFQVSVQCGSVWSSWSATGIFTTAAPAPCDSPTTRNLFAVNLTANSAQLNCSLPADQYLWQYRPVGDNVWITAGPTSQGYIDISGLQAATNYEFQVSVFCGSVQSTWSGSKVFTTLGGTRAGSAGMQVFPVPAKDQLQMQLHIGEVVELSVSVVDMTGRTVAVERWGKAEPGMYVRTVDVSALPSGIYVMNLRAGANIYREIFIIAAE